MNPAETFAAIICAAGNSSRMGGVKKEYCQLPRTDCTVLGSSVRAFAAFPCISRIIITVPDAGEAAARSALLPELQADSRIAFVRGGATRRASVYRALESLCESNPPGYVLIHDGCRPFVSARLIQHVMDTVQQHQAIIPLLPLIDTPKETDIPLDADFCALSAAAGRPIVTRHLRRDMIGLAQTPQAFAFAGIFAAHEKAAAQEAAGLCDYTDDAQVWGEFCGHVTAVPGEAQNRKITFFGDLEACL